MSKTLRYLNVIMKKWLLINHVYDL